VGNSAAAGLYYIADRLLAELRVWSWRYRSATATGE